MSRTPRFSRLIGLAVAAASSSLPCSALADGCLERPDALVADLGQHVVAAGFQRTLSCWVALQASAGLYGPWTVNYDVWGQGDAEGRHGDVIGAMARGRAFFFLQGTAPSGLWLSPFAQIGPVWGTREGEKRRGHAEAGGLTAGYTFALGERWLLGLGFGGQYHRASFDRSTAFPGFARLATTVDINVAYGF